MLQQLEFFFTFGEQKKKSKPKSKLKLEQVIDDPNREYMIKYKYDTITPQELAIFHNQIEKLIYDTIRKNYVQLQVSDVYQEIWKKIAKAKHSWKQDMGTKVSTWVVLVCLSVINGLRSKQKKHQERYIRYNDIALKDEEEEKADRGQTLAIKYGLVDDKNMRNMYFKQDFNRFVSSLSDTEKKIVDMVLSVGPDELNCNGNVKYKKKMITKSYIKSKMNIKQKQFDRLMSELKQKFNRMILHKES